MTQKRIQQVIQRFGRYYFLFVLAVVILVSGSIVYASMVARDQKTNDFQLGIVSTKIEEVFNEPEKMVPGKAIQKEVKVTNQGSIPQFARVMVQPEIWLESKEIGIKQILPARIGKEIEIKVDSTQWVFGNDGYYYYLGSLNAGESTPLLFKEVILNTNIEKSYQEAQVRITVKTETITTAPYAYRDAWWQGKIPTTEPLKQIEQHLSKHQK